MNFNYYLPVNLKFGSGRITELGTTAAVYGKKALLVTGKHSTKKSGLLDRACVLLQEAGVETIVFDQVEANPLTTTAEAGAEIAKREQCEMVIGLGGGSIMDAAKSIAFLAKNDGDISDYIFQKKFSDEALPIIEVPTTCGTGSEGNCFSVLTNPENGDKKSLRCNAIVPKASIIDPDLMKTMPKGVLASVGFDALCHCMEAYVSRAAQPLTDMMALEGMHRIAEHLPKLYKGEGTKEDWEAVTWGSTLGGMVINTAGVTAPHAFEHPASGLRNLVHGRGLAAVVPAITEASISGAPEKYAVISRILGGKDENDCADSIRAFLKKLDLLVTLSEQGVKEEDIDWMSENSWKVSKGSLELHPVVFDVETIKKIYRKSM